jgi:hypothetical protein
VRNLLRGLVTCAVVTATALPVTSSASEQPTTAIADAIATARTMSPRAIDRYEKSGHVEAFGSYRITVPRTWEESEPDEELCDWPSAGTPKPATLRANLPPAVCPPAWQRARPTVNDGAILFSPGAEPPKAAGRHRRLLTLRPRTTAPSQVFAVAGQPRQLLVKFREGAQTFQIAVAVGRDGRVAGRVIASILWNPDA